LLAQFGLVGYRLVFIGFIPLAILWIWLFVDLFLTASMVREKPIEQ